MSGSYTASAPKWGLDIMTIEPDIFAATAVCLQRRCRRLAWAASLVSEMINGAVLARAFLATPDDDPNAGCCRKES
jgi:hypothetical protein